LLRFEALSLSGFSIGKRDRLLSYELGGLGENSAAGINNGTMLATPAAPLATRSNKFSWDS
jgi:hypothetical protein